MTGLTGIDFSLTPNEVAPYPWLTTIPDLTARRTGRSYEEALIALVTDTLGWQFWGERDYDLFVYGLRNDLDAEQRDANTFNDLIGVIYSVGGVRYHELYPATTDPGVTWRKDPKRGGGGVGIVREGQWRGVYKLGCHGDEEALVEQAENPFQVYRDADFNERLTLNPATQEAGWGFNMHDAGTRSTVVNLWSGGCQVHAVERTMYRLVELVKRQARAGLGDVVSYTLMRASWLWRDVLEVRQEYVVIQDL